MAIKCANCGLEHEDGTPYCECGAELPEPEIVMLEEETAPTPLEEEAAPPEPVVEEPSPEALAPPVASAAARLIVTRGAQLGVEYSLNPGENEIGRWDDDAGSMPHIDLDSQDADGYVHHRHAMIRFDGSQWWLEHLKEPPSNPTRIRGRGDRLEVGTAVALQNGDEIVVGRVILKFVMD
ncbi:MAG: FHA domain-containing protein [Anaerolineae bacterium]|nr:FHA domain-containing protein [Anaerolineae bacterium]